MAPATRLNEYLAEAGSPALAPELVEQFDCYLKLLQKWNARTNLTAIRSEDEILRRHFVESILCAHSLPLNIVSLLDYGSGAGFPGVPIALIRKEIQVTLAESQGKKIAFLREAVRALNVPINVYAGRAEGIQNTFDCVTLRAVDNMSRAVQAASQLVAPSGWLAVLTTSLGAASTMAALTTHMKWQPLLPLPCSTERVLLLGRKPRETAD